jgi:hypothetical protein
VVKDREDKIRQDMTRQDKTRDREARNKEARDREARDREAKDRKASKRETISAPPFPLYPKNAKVREPGRCKLAGRKCAFWDRGGGVEGYP